MKIKQVLIAASSVLIISLQAEAQLKVSTTGAVSVVGAITSQPSGTPASKLQVIGNAVFSKTASHTYAPMIVASNSTVTATTPEYTWSGDYTTGIFHPAAWQIGFSTGGTERMRIHYNGALMIATATSDPGSYKLYVNGSTYCSAGVWSGSDRRFKNDIKPIEGALEKILKINGTTYQYKKEEFKELNFNEGRNMGFIAQELKEVLPEAVRLETNGFYSVNYSEIIPVVVEAMKEQNKKITDQDKKITDLEAQLSYCCTNKQQTNTNDTGNNSALNDSPRLLQNNPNPFTRQTTIGYYLPKETQSASVMIFDMQGKLVKTIAVATFENASLTINANELSAGMFMYSLVADGKEVDSKRMILTQ